MAEFRQAPAMNRDEIQVQLISVLKMMTEDWDLDLEGSIGPQTRLIGDLEFESIDVVQLAVSIEQSFNRENLPFEKLFMADGDYVSELEVSRVVDFLCEHLS